MMIGLDAVGKTTIMYKLKPGEVETACPTIGFLYETIEYTGKHFVSFTTWDVGGRDKMRPLWRRFYKNFNCNAVVFVVDSNDHDRIDDAREELMKIMNEDELMNTPLLVFGNKQDLPNAMSTVQLTEKLGLHNLQCQQWFVQGSCAITGDGLYEGFDWLLTTLHANQAGNPMNLLQVKSGKLEKPVNTNHPEMKKQSRHLDQKNGPESETDTESTAATETLEVDA